jgi:hypothetical protein
VVIKIVPANFQHPRATGQHSVHNPERLNGSLFSELTNLQAAQSANVRFATGGKRHAPTAINRARTGTRVAVSSGATTDPPHLDARGLADLVVDLGEGLLAQRQRGAQLVVQAVVEHRAELLSAQQ